MPKLFIFWVEDAAQEFKKVPVLAADLSRAKAILEASAELTKIHSCQIKEIEELNLLLSAVGASDELCAALVQVLNLLKQ